jgi:monoamine oxidase
VAGTIRLKTEVLAIRLAGPKASVVLKENGKGPVQTACDYVICTIPFGVLRRLDVRGFSAGKQEAVRNLSYASSTKVLIHCKERFWENDPKYGIFGGASLSDQIIRSVYYPSDNAPAATPSAPPPQAKGLVTRFHPELQMYADDHASMVWDQFKWSAGAFSFLQPGDQTAYLQNAVQAEGAVHFAGEHCSTDQAWIQGAIMSGLRAVEEIVAR